MISMIEDKVAIIPLFDPDKSKGGIWIPETAKDRCDQGIVKYIGPKCKYTKPGDYVFFSGYAGTALQFEDEGVMIIMREKGIQGSFAGKELDDLEIPGMFFEGQKDKGKRTFFPATYEFAIDLIQKALQDAPFRLDIKSIDMLENRPKQLHEMDDYVEEEE